MLSTTTLARLQAWYASQVDGDWEHSHGVHILTLDNPGWSVDIDLAETQHADRPFPESRHNYEHGTDWWICRKVGAKLKGRGGPSQLESILTCLLDWLED